VNDRGKLLCEALGTALATDENLFYFFFIFQAWLTGNISKTYIREKCISYYERKENHVLVMTFARCVRGIVHYYNNAVELALSLLFFCLRD
jgi:hypothetical protein